MKRQRMLAVALSALLLAAMACVFSSVQTGPLRSGSETVSLGDAEQVDATVRMSVGEFNIEGGADDLLTLDYETNVEGWDPEIAYEVSGSVGNLDVQAPDIDTNEIPTDEVENRWTIRFADGVPLDLDVRLGAGESDLDLTTLDLTDLRLSSGAGRVEVAFADTSADISAGVGDLTVDLSGTWTGDALVDVNGGVGRLTLRLPADVGVVVEANRGLGNLTAVGLTQNGNRYVNAAYDASDVTLTVTLDAGVGDINLNVVE